MFLLALSIGYSMIFSPVKGNVQDLSSMSLLALSCSPLELKNYRIFLTMESCAFLLCEHLTTKKSLVLIIILDQTDVYLVPHQINTKAYLFWKIFFPQFF